MVVDAAIAHVTTFSFDTCSENLMTEIGAFVYQAGLAQQLQALMAGDLRSDNVRSAAAAPEQCLSPTRRGHVPARLRLKSVL